MSKINSKKSKSLSEQFSSVENQKYVWSSLRSGKDSLTLLNLSTSPDATPRRTISQRPSILPYIPPGARQNAGSLTDRQRIVPSTTSRRPTILPHIVPSTHEVTRGPANSSQFNQSMIGRRPTAPLYVAPVAHRDTRGLSSGRNHGTDEQQIHEQQHQQYQRSSLNIKGVAGRRNGGALAIS